MLIVVVSAVAGLNLIVSAATSAFVLVFVVGIGIGIGIVIIVLTIVSASASAPTPTPTPASASASASASTCIFIARDPTQLGRIGSNQRVNLLLMLRLRRTCLHGRRAHCKTIKAPGSTDRLIDESIGRFLSNHTYTRAHVTGLHFLLLYFNPKKKNGLGTGKMNNR